MRRLVAHPLLIASVLAAIAYAPALNNGFIADDYVILQESGRYDSGHDRRPAH